MVGEIEPLFQAPCLHLHAGTGRCVRAAIRGSGGIGYMTLSPVPNLDSLMWTIELPDYGLN